MTATTASMVCSGCGTVAPPTAPFRCERADDGADHVVVRRLGDGAAAPIDPDERNPFLRYRRRLYAHHVALGHGLGDADVCQIISRLDERVAAVDGTGFVVTDSKPEEALAERIGLDGTLWVKDETGNVSGSHKARHLMGVMIYLEVLRQSGLTSGERPPLAISSCGNAALAAAVVARAAEWPLSVYVPTWADPLVVERLEQLGASLNTCERSPGVPGDPCTLAFREAVTRGAIPFSCQGPDNGLAVEGGLTLGYELAEALDGGVDRVFVQVGGGALASSCMQALEESVAMGLIPRMPSVYAVQTTGCFPLARAYARVVARLLGDEPAASSGDAVSAFSRADQVSKSTSAEMVQDTLRYAAAHRGDFMWPWEDEPHSIAHGILDDETYDWLAIVRGMVTAGGHPLVVDEDLLAEAHAAGRKSTSIPVDPTGSAGLAGLMQLHRAGLAKGGSSAVLFTGVDRSATDRAEILS